LSDGGEGGDAEQIRRHTHTGRPLGAEAFVRSLEQGASPPAGAPERWSTIESGHRTRTGAVRFRDFGLMGNVPSGLRVSPRVSRRQLIGSCQNAGSSYSKVLTAAKDETAATACRAVELSAE